MKLGMDVRLDMCKLQRWIGWPPQSQGSQPQPMKGTPRPMAAAVACFAWLRVVRTLSGAKLHMKLAGEFPRQLSTKTCTSLAYACLCLPVLALFITAFANEQALAAFLTTRLGSDAGKTRHSSTVQPMDNGEQSVHVQGAFGR